MTWLQTVRIFYIWSRGPRDGTELIVRGRWVVPIRPWDDRERRRLFQVRTFLVISGQGQDENGQKWPTLGPLIHRVFKGLWSFDWSPIRIWIVQMDCDVKHEQSFEINFMFYFERFSIPHHKKSREHSTSAKRGREF